MPLVLADRVVEQTTTQGTNNFELIGTSAGYQAFSVVGNGSTVYYTAEGVNDDGTLTGQWEVGQGVYNAGVLSRDTILSSSTGSKVSFSAGQKNVFIDLPSEKAVVLDDTDKVSGYNISGGTINGTSIGATTASTGKFTSVTTPSVTATTNDLTLSAISTGAIKFNTPNGQQVQISDSGVVPSRYIDLSNGSAASRIVSVPSTGSSDLNISAFGTSGNVRFFTNNLGQEQLRVAHTASAVNYFQVTGGATTVRPVISAQGSDTNIGLQFTSKGTGTIRFDTRGGNGIGLLIGDSGSATNANYIQITGSPTNQEPTLIANGSDANINFTLQSKGTGSIDLASGSTGVNVSNGTTVTAITRTAGGSGYTSFPSVAISAPNIANGVQATASVTRMFNTTTPTIQSGGTGYTVNDTLTVVGGTPNSTPAIITVTSVSAGVITGVTATALAYNALPTNPVSVTGGTGTGATFNLTWSVDPSGLSITNAGSGYTSQPTVTFSGGGGSGASAYAFVGGGATIRALGNTGTQSLDFAVAGSIISGVPAFRIRDSSGDSYPMVWNFTGSTNIIAQGATNAGLTLGANGTGGLSFTTSGTGTVQQFRVSHTASAVNYVQVTGSSTGNRPIISAQGSDANISWALQSKGTFGLTFLNSSNGIIGTVTHSGSSTPNYLQLAATTTTGAPALQAQGGDTNIDLSLTTKGTGALNVIANGATQFRVGETAITNAVNYVSVFGGATGAAPRLLVRGTDTNINLLYSTKGSGEHVFRTNDTNTDQFRITHTASAVNYVQVTGSATGSAPRMSVQGSDSTAGLGISAKGGAQIFFQNNGSSNTSLVLNGGTSTVNYLQINASNTTVAPSLQALGNDTNIDLTLTPKGTGRVQFGTHTATADTAISGYIEIKDAGGTVRKLAVIS